jgi:hypothetical protein
VLDGKALLSIELLKVGRRHHPNRLIGRSNHRTRCSPVRNCGAKRAAILKVAELGIFGIPKSAET